MRFNIYIDDQMGAELNKAAKTSGKTHDALIREAIAQCLPKSIKPTWPREVLDFQGVACVIAFESYRKQIKSLKEDPLV